MRPDFLAFSRNCSRKAGPMLCRGASTLFNQIVSPAARAALRFEQRLADGDLAACHSLARRSISPATRARDDERRFVR
jgi:hypothetical protein